MIERQDALEALVMDAIANDYESLAMIESEVAKWASEEGLCPTPEEIWKALSALMDKGFAKAYRITSTDVTEVQGQPDRRDLQDHYFLLTRDGKSAIRYD